MGYVYKIAPISEELERMIDAKFDEHGWYFVDERDCTPRMVLEISAFAHAVAQILDPLYSGAEVRTVTDTLFDIEDAMRGYARFDALRQLLSDLVSFERAKVTELTRDLMQTVLREEGTPDYDTIPVSSPLRAEIQTALDSVFLAKLEQKTIVRSDVQNIRRYGILLDCIEPHYYCDLSGREEGGVSACERFYHAVECIPDCQRAFEQAILVLYTIAVYGTARVRRIRYIPETPIDEETELYF